MVLQPFPTLQGAQFNENGNFDDLALESLKQVESGANGSARGENVIDQHDARARCNRIAMYFQFVKAILKLVRGFQGLGR